jgi:hypothetical protein
MSANEMAFEHLVIDCPHCSGMGSRVRACSCMRTGGSLVISGKTPVSGEPFQDCLKCHGTGTLAVQCGACGSGGRVRGQMVVSAVNADTGQIASATIIPGAIEPIQFGPDHFRRHWAIPIEPVIHSLAAQIGLDPEAALRGVERYRWEPVKLGAAWDPDAEPAERMQMEARALTADMARRRRVLIGQPGRPAHTGLETRLAQLCSLAEAMRVDLVVWRHAASMGKDGRLLWSWWIGLALPGLPLPAGGPIGPTHTTLNRAVLGADPADMVDRLRRAREYDRPGGTPGHFVNSATGIARAVPGRPTALEAELERLGGEHDAAAAIWRDGTWHLTRVRIDRVQESFTPTDTGQIRRRHLAEWAFETQPPAPGWLAGPIPSRGCVVCETGTPWSTCDCVDAVLATAFAGCERCGGTGQRPTNSCRACGRTGRIHTGAVITVTDATGFTRHLNLAPARSEAPDAPALGDTAAPVSLRRLDSQWSLAGVLKKFGIDPASVVAAGGVRIVAEVLDGVAVAPVGTPMAALERAFCEQVSCSWAAGRVFWRIRTGPTRPLNSLVAIAHAFGFDIAIAARHRPPESFHSGSVIPGTRWAAAVLTPDQAVGPQNLPGSERGFAAAIDACWDHLHRALNVQRLDPLEVLNAPQQPDPPMTDVDEIESCLDGLARRFAAGEPQTIAMRFTQGLVSVTASGPESVTGERDTTTLAEAATFADVAELLRRLRARIHGASDLVAALVKPAGDAEDRLRVVRFLGPGTMVCVRYKRWALPGPEDDVSDHVRLQVPEADLDVIGDGGPHEVDRHGVDLRLPDGNQCRVRLARLDRI